MIDLCERRACKNGWTTTWKTTCKSEINTSRAKCRVGVVRTYIVQIGTELYCVTTLEKCTIG